MARRRQWTLIDKRLSLALRFMPEGTELKVSRRGKGQWYRYTFTMADGTVYECIGISKALAWAEAHYEQAA